MSTLEVYDAHSELLQSRIKLKARSLNDEWRNVPVLFAASMDEAPHAFGGCEGWANLSCDDSVDTPPDH